AVMSATLSVVHGKHARRKPGHNTPNDSDYFAPIRQLQRAQQAEEEDARRPSREREYLVNERSRITNRMKSALARFGVRGFKPHLRKAPERLAGLRTAEGTGLPAHIS